MGSVSRGIKAKQLGLVELWFAPKDTKDIQLSIDIKRYAKTKTGIPAVEFGEGFPTLWADIYGHFKDKHIPNSKTNISAKLAPHDLIVVDHKYKGKKILGMLVHNADYDQCKPFVPLDYHKYGLDDERGIIDLGYS